MIVKQTNEVQGQEQDLMLLFLRCLGCKTEYSVSKETNHAFVVLDVPSIVLCLKSCL